MTISHLWKLARAVFGKLQFSDMQKPLKDTAISFRIPADLKEWIEAEAERLGMSTSELVELLLQSLRTSIKNHGDHIKWPPSFTRFADNAEVVEKD